MSYNPFIEDVGPKTKTLNGTNENKSMTMIRENGEYNLIFLDIFFELLLNWK